MGAIAGLNGLGVGGVGGVGYLGFIVLPKSRMSGFPLLPLLTPSNSLSEAS